MRKECVKELNISFQIIHKHPSDTIQDINRKRESVRAELYEVFKKYK